MGVLTRAALVALASCAVITAHAAPGDRLDRSALRPTFADEFDGPPSLADADGAGGTWKTNWFYGDQHGTSSRVAGDDIYVDRRYADIDPFLSFDGQVAIVLSRNQRPADPRLAGAKFTTGLLTTERSFHQRYGYFEAKVTMPGTAGTWPAFWLYSAPVDHWTGGLDDEIDVVEGQGLTPRETLHSIHRRFAWTAQPGGDRSPAVSDLSFKRSVVDTRKPHVYGVLWTRDALVWYVDDVEVARTDNPGLHAEMYVLLSMGAGGWGRNVVADGFRSAQMRIDYVRVHALRSADAP